MKVVQIVPSLSQSTGGLFVSISNLARYSMKDGTAVTICGPREEITAAEEAAWGPAEICTYPQRGPKRLAYTPALVEGLGRIAPDLVHPGALVVCTGRAPKMAEPSRTTVAPSRIAASKSPVMPMLSSSAPVTASRSRSSRNVA